ncbi:MAG: DNA phosphorothioation system sulfurtransferase DndC, partial [Planctomycetes bacterium]|nr:DNA phosphorothioation system sulfurtransferase DndC [Planctomycetota bacterium]
LAELPPDNLHKPVFVISSDTFVETPVIVDHVDSNLDAVNRAAKEQGLPFEAHKVVPQINDTFWVCLLGKGYPAPTSKFRWCTERMKIKPADRFILDRVAEFGEVVMVLGARRGESNTRDQVLKAHEVKGSKLRRHSSLASAYVYTPIELFSTQDVWTYILQVKSPWGIDNGRLIGMYKNALAGECPLVVDTSTPSCGNSRFGCWVCTVVEKDHSMESLIDSGEVWMEPLLDFRDFLASHRDPKLKRQYREYKRRNGRIMANRNTGKVVPGPYKIEYRRKWLRRLLKIEKEIRENGPEPNARLISTDELLEIRKIWRSEEQDWEDSVPKIYREETGQELEHALDDSGALATRDAQLLSDISRKHGVPDRLVHKLLDKVRDKQGMGRRSGIYGEIDSVFREDWLTDEEIVALHEDDAEEEME